MEIRIYLIKNLSSLWSSRNCQIHANNEKQQQQNIISFVILLTTHIFQNTGIEMKFGEAAQIASA